VTSSAPSPEPSPLAKVYSGIRDVAIYIGESSPGRRWPLGPWRPIEWVAIILIGWPTLSYVDHHKLGSTLPVVAGGLTTLTVVLVAIRMFLPKNRPSLAARAVFAYNTLRPPHGFFEQPSKVADNIVFTKRGVYAEYLFDGVSSALDSVESHADAALLTRNLGRYLPSGSMIRGLLVADDTSAIIRNMVGDHQVGSPWIIQCRHWQSVIENPTRQDTDEEDIDSEGFQGPARQRFWLTIPVDCGTVGRTRLGRGRQLWDWMVGRDKQDDDSIQDYGQVAATIVSALPDRFNLRPATPEQIQWFYRHRATLGVLHEPMPQPFVNDAWPPVRDANDITKIEYHEADNAGRPWWRPNFRPLVKVGDSYQTFLTIEHYPKTGVRFPRSSYLHALLRINTQARIEWMQHILVRTPEEVQPINRRKTKNIRDQIVQRDDNSLTTSELFDKLHGTAEYSRELESTPAERELDHTVVIAVGADDIGVLEDAVTQIRQDLDKVGIVVRRRRGTQAALAKTFFTGGEEALLDEFRNPTTAHLWSLFLPFISGWIGDTRGQPLAIDQGTAHPSIILHEPEASARHDFPTVIAAVGDPGGGKSKTAKIAAGGVLLRGGRAVIFEPDMMGEWFKALTPFQHLGIRFIDPMAGQYCFDTLLMCEDPAEAERLSAAHVLPWIGVPVNHVLAKRYRRLISPEVRERLGIESHCGLLNYLNGQDGADNDELLNRLEVAARDFPAFFDDTLQVYRPDECAATVYLTGRLKLPDAEEMEKEHLYMALETPQRTGLAVYGLLVELEQTHMFNRLDRYDLMVFEECAEMCSFRLGQKILHLISRKGRRHNTGAILITQDFREIQKMNDKFIVEKWILRIKDRGLAFQTLKWAGFDVRSPHDSLVTELCENTSPGNRREQDSVHGEAGAVDKHRRGEGFIVDKLGRRTRCQFCDAPTPEQAEATNTSVRGGGGMSPLAETA
jgi:AAA-like domain